MNAMRLSCLLVVLPIWLAGIVPAAAAEPDTSNIRRDERVIFFPTDATLSADGKAWSIPVHGWVFEPESVDLLRNAVIREIREDLAFVPDRKSVQRFEERMRLFLVDNERSKQLVVRIAGDLLRLPPSDKDGHCFGTLTLAAEKARANVKDGWLNFEAMLPRADTRRFTGAVQLVEPEGLTVVSDIDDTVKITQVTDKAELVANTFFREYRVVEGMAETYRRWQADGASFTFVSGSPWQLASPLSAMLDDAKFPRASISLRRVRLKNRQVADLLDSPEDFKLTTIGDLFKRYPGRRFVLVGDSGERDPEVYGRLTREVPAQVVHIFIRDVTSEPADAARYRSAFQNVPGDKWTLFKTPAEIRGRRFTLPSPPQGERGRG